MFKRQNNSDEIVQSSLSELILFLLFFFLILLGSILTTSQSKARVSQPKIGDYIDLKNRYDRQKQEYLGLSKRVDALASQIKKIGQLSKPIILSESDGFYFERGKHSITVDTEIKLVSSTIPKMEELIENYGSQIASIEIIGHTDQQRLPDRQPYSDLDIGLIPYYGSGGGFVLTPADNVGLGMARAITILNFLRSNSPILAKQNLLPYSAGQLIETNNTFTNYTDTHVSEPHRRRVEIRIKTSP